MDFCTGFDQYICIVFTVLETMEQNHMESAHLNLRPCALDLAHNELDGFC